MLLIQKDVWEEFLLKYSPESIFQSWLWGEVQKSQGKKIWRLGFYEEKKLVGIAQIFKVIARRGTFLHVRHGPVLVKPCWREFFDYVRKLAKEENAWFVRINPLISDLPKDYGLIPSPIHAMDAEICWILDLDKSDDELLSNMRKTTRYEIRKAEKMGVEIVTSTSENDLNHFIFLYQKTARRQGFAEHTGIFDEFSVFTKDGKALLYLGKYKKEVLAAAIILFYGKQAIYHHSASIPSQIPVNYLLQWEVIREAKRRAMLVYNFWGIAPEDNPRHPWRGITLFKKGFGGRQISYVHAHDLPISPFYLFPRTIETFRRIRKGY